ncbi:MAG: hydrogenase maturation protease [Kiritimatiellae bacterium]|nr:hydrogenase maturation protease [Kiritimatiellia bacterium]
MNPPLIIGLGNPLMSDEGIGPRIVAELAKRADLPEGVDILDLGTGGMSVLHAIAGRRRLIAIDCAVMGEEPGTIRRFRPEEADSTKFLSGLSLHEGDLFKTLELSRFLGECPEDVVIFGIEPKSLAPGEQLSPDLEARVAGYVAEITKELEKTRGTT